MPPTIITKESLYKRITALERQHCCNKNQFFDTFAEFPATGNTEVLYTDLSTGNIYIWNGTEYISADTVVVPEARICLNTATPAFAPLDVNNPTTAEVESYVTTNGISTDGTQVVYFVAGSCDEPDFIWTLNGGEITLSTKPFTAQTNNGLRITGGNVVLGSDDEIDPKDSELTADSFIHLDGNDLNFVGGGYRFGIDNTTTLSHTTPNLDGTTDLKYLWKVQALADKTVSFNFSTSTTNIVDTDINNDVFMIGWNLAPGGSAETIGKSAIGLSFENNYEPIAGTDLAEYHTFFITKAGVQKRLESYTINKDTPSLWERYNTVALDYYKHPVTDFTFFRLNSNGTSGDVNALYLDSRTGVQTGVEHFISPSQKLYYIRPVNFATGAGNIWQNTIEFTNFGNFKTAPFESIKYSSVVVFNFKSALQTYANDAAAAIGGVSQHGLYATPTGEVRIKL
jgi:hypothetical protein